MDKSINIAIELSTGEYTTLPLVYDISNEDGNENIKLISCRVNLHENEVPEWLSPAAFTIRQVYSPGNFGSVGVTVTELGSIPCRNIDSANFVDTTHEQISVKEKLG